MPISDRIEGSIEKWSAKWGDRLASWMGSWVMGGINRFLEANEPEAIDLVKDQLTIIRNNPLTPQELKNEIDQLIAGTKPIPVVVLLILGCAMLIPTITAIFNPLGNLWSQQQEQLLHSYRLDPSSVITAWRRDKTKYEKFFGDLEDQGWSDERIDALKFFTQVIPQAQDIIRFALREVYSPEIAQKYGQFQDIPTDAYADAEKAGLPKETFDKFWAAHWYLPSSSEGFEMLHRGIITEDELKALLKANDIMPYWRDQLIKISWNIPTRVDVRRFWEMRTIDEARLREIYTSLGYHDKDLDDYVLWTKIYVDFPTLLARYKNGWITLEEVKNELVAMGMKPDHADIMIEEKIKKEAPERAAGEKALTKTDIYKGVKQGRITRAEGMTLLMDLGYDADEATYLLDINIPRDEEDTAVQERQLTKADILNGLKTEVITRDIARDKLLELRYSAANAELLLKIYDAQVKPPEDIKLKEASKTDIVLGVKKGIITPEEGYIMLLEVGFSPEASLFILTIQTEESPFSPINFAEFKDLTQKYRKAAGLEGPAVNEDVKKAAAEVVRLTGERDSIKASVDQEQRGLIGVEPLPAEATARLKKLQTSLRKVEAALATAKTEYERLVAEQKYT